jgi:hypothetical protein
MVGGWTIFGLLAPPNLKDRRVGDIGRGGRGWEWEKMDLD